MHNQEAHSGLKAAAIIVAAGSGTRLGGAQPKQFQQLSGKPMLVWSVETMLRCNKIAAVAVVVVLVIVALMVFVPFLLLSKMRGLRDGGTAPGAEASGGFSPILIIVILLLVVAFALAASYLKKQ